MQYSLPGLKYPYNALEPVFSAEALEIHYTCHHAGYVNKLNELLNVLGYTAPENINDFISGLKYSSIPEDYRDLVKFHAGGHANHSFFWEIMKPYSRHGMPGQLPEALEETINAEYKTFRSFKEKFTEAAMKHLGSGWTWLSVSRKDPKKLFISTTTNHDNPQMLGYVKTEESGLPILTLDLWEHSYYLKYKNRKADYIEDFWSIVNWDAVYERYQSILAKFS